MERYKEFCVEWNNVIPFKLRDSDLAFPNEIILTNALLQYLGEFGFSVVLLKEAQHSENAEVRHKFKLELCNYINHLYRLGNESSHPFVYFDLLSPTPKKTYHVLKYLLNYFLFFNKMRLDVIEPTKAKIEKYKEIAEKTDCDKAKLKKAKVKQQNIEQEIEKYKHEIPELSDKIENLKTTERDQNEIKQSLMLTLEDLESCVANLKMIDMRLRLEIVTNDEADSITNKIQTIEKELQEQTEVEHATLEGNRSRKIAISKLEELINYGENVIEEDLLQNFDKRCLLEKKCSELDKIISQSKHKNEHTKLVINQNKQQIKNMNNDLKEKKLKLQNMIEYNQKHHIELTKKLNDEEATNEEIDFKLHNIEDSIIKEEEIENTIENAKSCLLKNFQERDPFLLNIS